MITFWRTVRRGLDAGANPDTFAPLVDALLRCPERRLGHAGQQLRGHIRLALLLARAADEKKALDWAARDEIRGGAAQWLATLELARHNAQYDRSGTLTKVDGLEEPARTFGRLGATLGSSR